MEAYWMMWKVFAGMGLGVIPILLLIPAPYGKFTRNGWGPKVSGKISWIIQEAPCFFYAIYYMSETPNLPPESFCLLVIFAIHYYQRAFIYGYLMSNQSVTTIPVVISALFFNLVNGYLQCAGIVEYDKPNTTEWSPRFSIGIFIWALGCLLNVHCDHILRTLRQPGEHGYKIPNGGVFKYVSAANYFTESIEWLGWGIACQNWSGWLFLVLTISNLLPRAISQHKWYQEKFNEYKSLNRKAYIPFIL